MPLPLFDTALAVESMRYSDFDANSAYGEVIDNSIQAEAQNIKIQFDYQNERKQLINEIAFGDDGYGMGEEIIYKCLQAGFSTRYNDRTGMGRFGIGATLAAINQCMKIEIYSKQKGSNWLYTYTDIEKTTETAEPIQIAEPTQKELPSKYAPLISEEQGTLVIWRKYDRQVGKASAIIEDFKIWAGRTYRKFIWGITEKSKFPVNIYINDLEQPVYAIDPLYLVTEKTKFPNDPKATKYEPMEIRWPVPEGKGEMSPITIRMSLLPEKFRDVIGSGSNKEAKERYMNMNEGISILRNDREVFYGHIPYFSPRFKQEDRFWGCEISFNAVLDSSFLVRNIKRGARPEKELREKIQIMVNPTRDEAIEEAAKYRLQVKKEKATTSKYSHRDAENIAHKTPLPKNKIDRGTKLDEASKDERELFERNPLQPFTIKDTESWNGDDFFRTRHLGGKSLLFYNAGHIFMQEILDIMDKIGQSGSKQYEVENLRTMIDLLIMSFAKAEANFYSDEEMNIKDFLSQLKKDWGNSLAAYTKTRKREESKG